ncbi:MAG: hypothetical protein ACE15F_10535 [bacterium]
MTLDQIRLEGLKALVRHLGPIGMIRFIQQYEIGRGDYTKERHQWLHATSVKELADKIKEKRA